MVSTALVVCEFLIAFHFSEIGNGHLAHWSDQRNKAMHFQSISSHRSYFAFTIPILLLDFSLEGIWIS